MYGHGRRVRSMVRHCRRQLGNHGVVPEPVQDMNRIYASLKKKKKRHPLLDTPTVNSQQGVRLNRTS
ncbi:Uncharacterized protein HZ326_18369 [Fusarium oxysporum f. sp. albedinis]|nr:Uncharacterized protein HZ326_18369 [Fusarium oxysporum f. sp. albedinis]